MKSIIFHIILLFVVGVLSTITVADAEVVTVQEGIAGPNATVQISILVDDPSRIAAAAFTIAYDTNALTLSSVDGSFFDAFVMGPEIPGTGTMISGARARDGAATPTLFVLHFDTTASMISDSIIDIVPSIISNTNAGYDAAGEGIPFLVGIDPLKTPPDPGAYPALDTSIISGIIRADQDKDGIPDTTEIVICTDPADADTDDDGIPDGDEDLNHNDILDPGETDPCLTDTDGDGIQDGTEVGLTLVDIGPDTDPAVFVADADPATHTDPTLYDTDGDGMSDGEEDDNHNGRVDAGEDDPNQKRSAAMPWIDMLLLQ